MEVFVYRALLVLFTIGLREFPSVSCIDGFSEKATLNQYPWLASIEVRKRYECPAAVITSKHVLAPHRCVFNVPESDIKIRLGTDRRLSGGKEYNVVKKSPYNDKATTKIDVTGCTVSVDDIVVLELDNAVSNKTLVPVQLAHKCENLDADVLVKIVGWGNSLYSECKNEIETMTVPVMDLDCCNKALQSQLKPGHFCAGFKNNADQDSHLAELGDFMIHEGRIVGIVTYDSSCDEESKPTVYTNVGYYHKFISEKTGLKDEDLTPTHH